ncbi:Vinexin, partial [Phlyctochytrium planicorne]
SPSLPSECLDLSGTLACSPYGPSTYINITAISHFYSSITSDSSLSKFVPSKISSPNDWERIVYALTGKGGDSSGFCSDQTQQIRYYRTFVCARDVFGLSGGCNANHGADGAGSKKNGKVARRDSGSSRSYQTNSYRLLEATLESKQGTPLCPEICDTYSKTISLLEKSKGDLDARCIPTKDESGTCSNLFGKAVRNAQLRKRGEEGAEEEENHAALLDALKKLSLNSKEDKKSVKKAPSSSSSTSKSVKAKGSSSSSSKKTSSTKLSAPKSSDEAASKSCLGGIDDDANTCGFAGNVNLALAYCKAISNADPCCTAISDPSTELKAMNLLMSVLSSTSDKKLLTNDQLMDAFKTEVMASFDREHTSPASSSSDDALTNYVKKMLTAIGAPSDWKRPEKGKYWGKPGRKIVMPVEKPVLQGSGKLDKVAKMAADAFYEENEAPASSSSHHLESSKKKQGDETAEPEDKKPSAKKHSAPKKTDHVKNNKNVASSTGGSKAVTAPNSPSSQPKDEPAKSGGMSSGSIALLSIGCLAIVAGGVAAAVVVQRRGGSKVKKPFTIKKFNHNPMASTEYTPVADGGGGSGPSDGGVVNTFSSATADVRPRRVVYDYEPMQPDELLLTPGDLVEVSVEYDDGWGTGKNLSTGRIGTFPVTCLAK